MNDGPDWLLAYLTWPQLLLIFKTQSAMQSIAVVADLMILARNRQPLLWGGAGQIVSPVLGATLGFSIN